MSDKCHECGEPVGETGRCFHKLNCKFRDKAVLPSVTLKMDNIPTTECGLSCETIEDLETFLKTPLLEIKLSCGCKVKYQTHSDVPRKTVKCEHDNYFVRIVHE